MRHAIASLFYALGKAIDRPANLSAFAGDNQFGHQGRDRNRQWSGDRDRLSVQLHAQASTPIMGRFEPGAQHTYAALAMGDDQAEITVFLNRASNLHLLAVARRMEELFARFGEGSW